MCAIAIICVGRKRVKVEHPLRAISNYLLTDSSGSSEEHHATPFVTSTKELNYTMELFFKEFLQKCFIFRQNVTLLLKAAMQPFK